MNDSALQTRDLMACLGDSSRFRLVLQLLESEQCVSDLAIVVGLSQSCTTRHLQALQRAGIVLGTRDGKRVLFRLCRERPQVDELIAWAVREGALLERAGASHPRRVSRPRPRPSAGADALPVSRAASRAPRPEPRPAAQEPEPEEPPRHVPRQDLEDFLL